MRRFGVCCALLLAVTAWSPAEDKPPAPKRILETWHAAYFEGAQAGHVHTVVDEVTRDKAKLLRTTRVMAFKIKRYDSVVPFKVELVSEEKADGAAVALGMTTFPDKGPKLAQSAKVDGDKLVLAVPGGSRALPWKAGAAGMYHQDRVFAARKVKPGDAFTLVGAEPALMTPLSVRVAVKDYEAVDLLQAIKDKGDLKVKRVTAKLLRVEQKADKIKVGDVTLPGPEQVLWLDKDRLPVRYQWDFPGVGKVTLYQTTKEVAQKEGVAPALLPDIGLNTIVPVKQTIDKPHETASAVYAVTLSGDADPATAFAADARQKVRNVKGKTFELHVTAVRAPAKVDKPAPAKKEFLESSHFLDSDSAGVKKLAAKAVGAETDPWRKARKIAGWVHDNMKPSTGIGFATAGQVARDLSGDCRQHAMLAAAMCRAAKVPARTAIGLVYVREPGRRPVFVFHMWTEVYVSGQWLGLDATLGDQPVGACHLKVVDHSWRDTQTLAPLLPVAGVLGKLRIDVVRAK